MISAWSPDLRDTAIGGLATLLNREAWRGSDAGQTIEAAVSAAMRDPNPVVRMRAAEAAPAVHAGVDRDRRVAAIAELIFAEEHPAPRSVLLRQLAADTADAPVAVDAILERLLGADAVAYEPGGGRDDVVMALLTYLALVPRTSFAARTAESWCRNAPAHATAVEAFARCARDHLGPSSGDGRGMAFRLLSIAADAALLRWTRDPQELTPAADLSDDKKAELTGATTVAHAIAQQIYFASGAFEEKQGHQQPHSADLAEFADLAFPVLATCARLGVPQCVHQAVETMIFLSPLDEARALHAIAAAVPAEGLYAGDSLAGDAVIPYLERLLAEQRPLVLFEEGGVEAFRHLLGTFAAAGNEAALALAYTFADVFR